MSRRLVGHLRPSVGAWLRSLALATALVLLPATVALAAPGDLDPSFADDGISDFDWGADDVANAVLVQPDGKIVVAGSGDLGEEIVIGRLNADGTLDTSFNGTSTTVFGLGGHGPGLRGGASGRRQDRRRGSDEH